jgi:hypothetical protein
MQAGELLSARDNRQRQCHFKDITIGLVKHKNLALLLMLIRLLRLQGSAS